MALKPDRFTVENEIAYFCNDVAIRGVLLGFSTAGSGVSLDQTANLAVVPGANPSGVKPLGVLMNDMVNTDLTRYHINFYKDEMPVGGKCTILKKGWIVTDKIFPGNTPVGNGDTAYMGPSGLFATQAYAGGFQATGVGAYALLPVGKFLSSKDERGFAKVEVLLP